MDEFIIGWFSLTMVLLIVSMWIKINYIWYRKINVVEFVKLSKEGVVWTDDDCQVLADAINAPMWFTISKVNKLLKLINETKRKQSRITDE